MAAFDVDEPLWPAERVLDTIEKAQNVHGISTAFKIQDVSNRVLDKPAAKTP